MSDFEPQQKSKKFPYRRRARYTRDTTFRSDESVNQDRLSCQDKTSCVGKCRTERDPGPSNENIKCFCDEHCMVFRDCCADYVQYCLPIMRQNSTRYLNPELWKCNNNGGTVPFAKGVWMISTCPANWTHDEIAKNCTRTEPEMSVDCQGYFAPLTDEKNNTYKNRFCALCHGVEDNTSRFYEMQSRRYVSSIGQNNISSSRSVVMDCSKVIWKPPSGVSRRYCLDLTRNASCMNTSSAPEAQSDCLSKPPGIVTDRHGSKKLYFNRHCALCAGVALDHIVCGPMKIPGNLAPSRPGIEQWQTTIAPRPPPLPPLSILFGPNVPKTKPCEDGHVLDPVSKECRKTLSQEYSVPFFNRYSVSIQFKSQSGGADGNHSTRMISKALEVALRHCSAEIFTLEINHSANLTYSAHIIVAFPKPYVSQTNRSINCNLMIRHIPFSVINETWEPLSCAKIDIYKPSEYVALADTDSVVYINRTQELIPKIDYWSNQTDSKNGSVVPVGDIHICRSSLRLNCSGVFIQLKDEEYVILGNGSLYRNDSNTIYGIYDFTIIEGKAAVCIIPSPASSNTNDMALVVLTYVGISLSVACLSLVLVTYSLFKELRTLPGVNLMNLSISLLIAHSLFIAAGATQYRLVCTSIAVLSHYFYLASFTWMSIIAFDTYYTFSRTCRTRQRTAKWKGLFLAIGWTPALVFVVICYFLDQSGLVAIGYGGTSHCWINNANSNMFVFVIPVAFSILFNAILFSLTVISIRKIKKQT